MLFYVFYLQIDVFNIYDSNDASDMDMLIRFTVCQTCVTQLLALFDEMQSKNHTVSIAPPVRSRLEHLRSRGHDFILPSCTKRSFVHGQRRSARQ